jgi:hypothetical protein
MSPGESRYSKLPHSFVLEDDLVLVGIGRCRIITHARTLALLRADGCPPVTRLLGVPGR